MSCLSKASTLKKTLINNAIALAAYGVSLAAAWGIYHIITFPIPEKTNPFAVFAAIAALLYVICGFFLIPVEERSYLSVVSVAIAMVIIIVICMSLGEDGMIYYLLNPFVFLLLSLELPFQGTIYLLSPFLPSLLIYLGMVLRKVVLKKKGNP